MKALTKFLNICDHINEKVASYIAIWLLVVLMIFVFVLVCLRYIFNYGTMGAVDIPSILQLVIIALGGGYTLLCRGHISIDMLYRKWSTRTKSWVDSITLPFILFFAALLVRYGISNGLVSLSMHAVNAQGLAYPMVLLHVIAVLAGFLLGIQALAQWIRSLAMAILSKEI